LVNPAPIV